MNSVQTSFNKLAEDVINGNQIFEKPIKDYYSSGYLLQLYRTNKETFCALLTENFKNNGFQSYIDCYHTIGNFVLVPAYFNAWRYSKTNDFWDDSLILLLNKKDEEKWLYKNNEKTPVIWSKNDFIKYINYFFLWDYVSIDDKKYSVETLDKDFEKFFKKVTCYIQRRGIFMIAMLKIQQDFSDVYEMIQNMLLSDTVYEGYADVVKNIQKLTEDNAIYSILNDAMCRINEIKA